MKKAFAVFAILAMVTGSSTVGYCWGVWGHNHINKAAVLALPADMGMFFYNHADFMVQESIVPDLRKYTLYDKAEGCRHYIDLEWFHYDSPAGMPVTMGDAIARYGADSLSKYGMLPWYIEDMMEKLTNAFRKKNTTEILFLAADLGHYIGDANMPLHTSLNHNGQLTGQVGIHAFWESQLPELFGKDYRLYTGTAHYISDVKKATWSLIDSSHRLATLLLQQDKMASNALPADQQYATNADGQPRKNKFGQPVQSDAYAAGYHKLLAGMVERQLNNAIRQTADMWYTAWVNAGKPDLGSLDAATLTERNTPYYKEELDTWKKTGTVIGCITDREF